MIHEKGVCLRLYTVNMCNFISNFRTVSWVQPVLSNWDMCFAQGHNTRAQVRIQPLWSRALHCNQGSFNMHRFTLKYGDTMAKSEGS